MAYDRKKVRLSPPFLMNKSVARLLLFLATVPAIALAEERPPNVVIIFTDDQGFGDIGVNGAEGYETPNVDRMAAEGRLFTQWYASQPVCSASRAGLLTGCYSNRLGINGALSPGSKIGLNHEETTLAEVFKGQGYATAIFGKWHLGDHESFLPTNHGFDTYFGIPYSGDMWPFHPEAGPNRFPPLPLIENLTILRHVAEADQRMLTSWYTAKAVDFIGHHRDEPFFIYLPHNQPHVPLYVSERFEGTTIQGLYGDAIAEIDWSIGEILNAISTFGLDEQTLVIFTSDNGPWLSYGEHAGSAGPFREGKGTVWEGGVREPCVMRWPGKIPAGTVCDTAAMNIDLLPTLANLIGAPLPEKKIDGLDIWPLLAGEEGAKNPHKAYWFYYKNNELQAVQSGNWKLLLPHQARSLGDQPGGEGGIPAKYTNTEVGLELYDLASDPYETTDLAASRPEKIAELMVHVEQARRELGDSLTKAKGSELRPPATLTEEQHAALMARHWPNGVPEKKAP